MEPCIKNDEVGTIGVDLASGRDKTVLVVGTRGPTTGAIREALKGMRVEVVDLADLETRAMAALLPDDSLFLGNKCHGLVNAQHVPRDMPASLISVDRSAVNVIAQLKMMQSQDIVASLTCDCDAYLGPHPIGNTDDDFPTDKSNLPPRGYDHTAFSRGKGKKGRRR